MNSLNIQCFLETTMEPGRILQDRCKSSYLPFFIKLISIDRSYKELIDHENSNQVSLLDVDIRGVINLKKNNLNAKFIFIRPPSMEFLVSISLPILYEISFSKNFISTYGVTLKIFSKYSLQKKKQCNNQNANLMKRGTENLETINTRLEHALEDMRIAEQVRFDLVIENIDLKKSYEILREFFKKVGSIFFH